MFLFKKEELSFLEEKFKKQNFDSMDSFEFVEGSIPILVSAPHSVTQTRLGELKQSETTTGVMVDILHKYTGCHIFYKTRNDNDDANFDIESSYRDKLINFVKEKGVKYVFDIHIMSPKREHLIDIGTGFGKNIKNNEKLPFLSKEYFSRSVNRDKIKINEMFNASRDTTISSTVARECLIDAIQFEFNWKLVDYENNFVEFENIIESFIQLILSLK